MIPWELLASAPVPAGGTTLQLYRHGADFSIRVDGHELMNSRRHGSEEALAERALVSLANRPRPRVLVGGLGMGYTLAAALRRLPAGGRVVVAEVVPAVVLWNQGPLADLAGRPLEDVRVTRVTDDVATVLTSEPRGFDAILLDVDNGPRALSREGNAGLYSRSGLRAAASALRPGGVLALWSAAPDDDFGRRLKAVGYAVDEQRVAARASGKGGHHVIWLAHVDAEGSLRPPPERAERGSPRGAVVRRRR